MAAYFALTLSSLASISSSISRSSFSWLPSLSAWSTLSSQDIQKIFKQAYTLIMTEKILVTGPFGQVGMELIPELQNIYGKENVIALGHKYIPASYDGPLEKADITDIPALRNIFTKHGITQLYHLAALLSIAGEKNPHLTWNVNLDSLKGILDLCVELKIQKVFWASSIAAFGPTSPKVNTPQNTIIEPVTMYGVTKRTGQLLAQYYFLKFGLDIRSLRYPGIISWKQEPGGGTTDYAIDIFHGAINSGHYTCFVSEKTTLPMIYMDDVVKGTIQIMQADKEKIKVRTSYNMSGFSFTAEELAAAVNKRIPVKVEYKPDDRQKIADSWPDSIDDSEARKDWGWEPKVTLEEMVNIMVDNLQAKLKAAS